ncbi:SH3 domain-containing protein [Enterococcus sp. BWR-S5]|uniref:SH3 domain-containing protein n=1 Tax=Enterococcus sp. BWR-S5 TaxID=2787714 RepID=UPI0019236400|nr:SH3 domain-containing protein [Enterococcus sp. BWR-S5]MBL1223536.1 SH3 domain-containing protein [Enterococcus sp. BWR-S5]
MKKLKSKVLLALLVASVIIPVLAPEQASAEKGGGENQAAPTSERALLSPEARLTMYRESGRYYPDRTRPVKNSPSMSAPTVANYYRGESLYYDYYCYSGGYVWLSYRSANGTRRYVPWRIQNGTRFGYII